MPSGIGEIGPTAENANGNAAHQTDANKLGGQANFGKQMTQDHTSYVSRARVTRTAPPKPASNPLQFIQTKPFSLYKGVKEPVKRAEEVVKVKEIIKDEPEDWQSNLDSWKSCRRKRVEHIIDRVVEVKKLELEEHDRQRRKSKTFSEMMEDRGSKGRKVNLKIYAEDDSNDLSDLGIGTSSASGKSSLSEDFDNNSVLSDNPADNDKSGAQPAIGTKNGHSADGEYDSSTGSDVPGSSSLSPTHSVRPAATKPFGLVNPQAGYHTPSSAVSSASSLSKDSTPERSLEPTAPALVLKPVAPLAYQPPIQKRPSSTKIEDRLLNFEIMGASQQQEAEKSFARIELPKVDVLKRRELFESAQQAPSNGNNNGVQMRRRSSGGNGIVASMAGELSAKASSIKNRVSYIEQKQQQEKPLSPSADAAIVVNAEPKAKPAPTPEKKPDPVTTEAPDLKNHITIEPLEDGEDSGIAIDEATIQAPDETKNVDERPAMAVQPDVVPQANIESIEMIVAITSSPIEQNTETEPMLPSPEPTVFVEADAEPTATLPTSAAAKQIPAVDNDDDDDEQETSVSSAIVLSVVNTNNTNNDDTSTANNNHKQSNTTSPIINLPVVAGASVRSDKQAQILSTTITTTTTCSTTIVKLTDIDTTNNEPRTTNQQNNTTIRPPKPIQSTDVSSSTGPIKRAGVPIYENVSFAGEPVPRSPAPRKSLEPDSTLPPFAEPPPMVKQASVDATRKNSDMLRGISAKLSAAASSALVGGAAYSDRLRQMSVDLSSATRSVRETIEAKNERLKCQIVGVLEKNRNAGPISVVLPATEAPGSSSASLASGPLSPSLSTASTGSEQSGRSSRQSNGSRNIFDFIKANLLNETNQNLLEKSTFYVALSEHEAKVSQSAEDDVQSLLSAASATTSSSRLTKTDSTESHSSEVDRLLDEELRKLN